MQIGRILILYDECQSLGFLYHYEGSPVTLDFCTSWANRISGEVSKCRPKRMNLEEENVESGL